MRSEKRWLGLALSLTLPYLAYSQASMAALEGRLFPLVRALELRHPDSGRHSYRTAWVARLLAKELDADPERAYLAGLVHDLGKIGLPDSILLGRDRLSRGQRLRVKFHPIHTRLLLEQAQAPRWLVESASSHHEAFHGGGYPQGLEGEDIPWLGRIVAGADVLDALRSPRSYKPGFSWEKTYAILREEAKRKLDPRVVQGLIRIRPQLEREHGRFAQAPRALQGGDPSPPE